MKLPRRQFLHLAAAGSALDIVARLIGQSLSEQLGQSFVIENRSGASSNNVRTSFASMLPTMVDRNMKAHRNRLKEELLRR